MDEKAFEEYKEGIQRWNNRQDKRIEILEDTVENLKNLSVSIEKLATNMQNMLNEQIEQGKRIQKLENQDGEMWRKVSGYVITAVIGIIIGFIFKQFGM